MSEINRYDAQKKKMQGLCDEHELTWRFRKDIYPIMFTIRPVQGMDAQMSLLESVEDKGYISPDASMTWIFKDGDFETRVQGGTFTIPKVLRNKIENILLKMITYWQQYFFHDIMARGILRSGSMPVIDEDNANDTDEPEAETDAGEEDAPEVEIPEGAISFDEHLIKEATAIVRAENKVTIQLLQRRLNIGYSKAAQVRDELESLGVIGPIGANGEYEVLPADVPDEPTEDTEG